MPGISDAIRTKRTVFALLIVCIMVPALWLIGCRIIPTSHEDFRPSGTEDIPLSATIFNNLIDAATGLNFSTPDFHLFIPPGALKQSSRLAIRRINDPNVKASLPKGFNALSDAYVLDIEGQQTCRLIVPAEIGFSKTASDTYEPTRNIFIGYLNSENTWTFLEAAYESGVMKSESYHLSTWLLAVRNDDFCDTAAAGPPLVAASPTAMIASGTKFHNDLFLEFGISPLEPEHTLQPRSLSLVLYPIGTAKLSMVNYLKGDTKTPLTIQNGESTLIDLLSNPLIGFKSVAESASYTIRLLFSGLSTDESPDSLVWAITLTDSCNNRYEREGSVIFTSSADDAPQASPTVIRTKPLDGENDFRISETIEIEFDKEMNKTSINEAFSIKPESGIKRLSWISDNLLGVTFPDGLSYTCEYTIEISTAAKDIYGISLQAPFVMTFHTESPTDRIKPSITGSIPPDGARNVMTNTTVQIQFSESMNKSVTAAAISILPAMVNPPVFEWSSNSSKLAIIPYPGWQPAVNYEISVSSQSCDTAGNTLERDYTISFTTGTNTGPEITLSHPAHDTIATSSISQLHFRFSEPMNTSSVESAFSVSPEPPGKPSFNWSEDCKELAISWSSNFPEEIQIETGFSVHAVDQLNRPLSGRTAFTFFVADSTPPSVSSFSPAHDSTGNPVNSPIIIEFSEPMNTSSVEGAFSCIPSPADITFKWASSKKKLVVDTKTGWPGNAEISVSLAQTAKDVSNHEMTTDLRFSFKTSDIVAPSITNTNPADMQTGIPRDAPIEVTFSQPMNAESFLKALKITPSLSSNDTNFTWNADSTIVTIIHGEPLKNATTYLIEIASTAAGLNTDVALTHTFTFSFKTADTDPPIVISTTPRNGSAGVSATSDISIRFNKSMNPENTLQYISFAPVPVGPIETHWTDKNSVLVISFESALTELTEYVLTLSAELSDTYGNHFTQPVVLSFTTGDTVRPSITSVKPDDRAQNVAVDTTVTVSFSKAMNHASVCFSILPLNEFIVSWHDDATAILTFTNHLSENTDHKVEISEKSSDVFGNLITGKTSYLFRTGGHSSVSVISINPPDSSEGISPDTPISITFSRIVEKASIEKAFTLTPEPASETVFSWNDEQSQVTVTFSSALGYSTSYSVHFPETVAGENGKLVLLPFESRFTTTSRPEIIAENVYPQPGATDVASDAIIVFPFTKAMDRESSEHSFSLTNHNESIPGKFEWSNDILRFTPDTPMTEGFIHTLTLADTAMDSSGHHLGATWISTFTVSAPPEAPALVSFTPDDGMSGVDPTSSIRMKFSHAMQTKDAETYLSISPAPPGSPVLAWSENDSLLNLSFEIPMSELTMYICTVATGLRDIQGVPLPHPYISSFTTADVTKPFIESTSPSDGALDIPLNQRVIFRFSEAMDRDEFDFSIVPEIPGEVNLIWTANDKTVTLEFAEPLAENTLYFIVVASTSTDASGNSISGNLKLGFKTGIESVPAILSVLPSDGSLNIPLSSTITVEFDRIMDSISVENSFSLLSSSGKIPGSFSWASETVVFTPESVLSAGTKYTVSIASQATDKLGIPLAEPWASEFSTDPGPAPYVVSIYPADHATGIPVSDNIEITFSKPMKTTALVFSIIPEPVGEPNMTWSESDTKLKISYTGGFAAQTEYMLSIGTDTCDIFGLKIGQSVTSAFTTETIPAPQITSIEPEPGSLNTPLQTEIKLTFTQSMSRESTQQAFSITPEPADEAVFIWSDSDRQLEVTFAQGFTYATTYEITIGTTAASIYGIKLETKFNSPFTTISRPVVLSGSLFPGIDATNVASNTAISIPFSKAMNEINTQNSFSLMKGGISQPGIYAWSENTMIFTPAEPLDMNTIYSGRITTLACDTDGNTLAGPFEWDFTTQSANGSVWERKRANDPEGTQFTQRYGHALTVFNNYLWVIGGNDGSMLNDVWRSSDGSNWTRVLANDDNPGTSRFTPRSGHSCLVFDGKIWIIGGEIETTEGFEYKNDVWSSADGTIWNCITPDAPFEPRGNHFVTDHLGAMHLMGGVALAEDGSLFLLDDCWKSTDGLNWEEIVPTVSYFPRMQACCGSVGNKLWIWGGFGYDSLNNLRPLNDIWSSSNGVIWTPESMNAPFASRYGAAATYHDQKYWLIGGLSYDSDGWEAFLNDVWSSSDGKNWLRILDNEPAGETRFQKRYDSKAAAMNGKMYLIGGEGQASLLNDVWSAE